MMMNPRSIVLLAALAAAPMVACGPKKGPSGPVEGETINPRQAFSDGVQILKTPGKNGSLDYATAHDLFVAAVEVKADFTKAWYNVGWTAQHMGNQTVAENAYRQALQLDGSYSEALFNLAQVLTDQGRGMAAVSAYQAYLKAKPGDIKVRANLIEALLTAEMWDEAVGEIREILRSDPEDVSAYRALSRVYFAKGEYGMSLLCAEKAKTLAKGDPGIYNNIGVTHLVMNDEVAGIAEFKTAIKLDPENVEANLNLGYLAVDSGHYDLAKTCFSAALASDPGNLDAKMGLAVALRGVKEFGTAAKLYDAIIKAEPSYGTAYFNAATLHGRYTKDYKRALRYLEDYVRATNDGSIGPDHQVYARMDAVRALQAKEDERLAGIARKKQDAADRKKRQRQQFEHLKTEVAKLGDIMEAWGSCGIMIEMGGTEMGMMVLEQAQMVIEADEVDMAADDMTFVEQIMPQLEGNIPYCQEEADMKAAEAAAGPEEGNTDEGQAPADGADAPDDGATTAPESTEEASAPTEEASASEPTVESPTEQ